MSTNRSLLVIGGGILALVALSIAVILLAEARGPATYEPGSPQEAMQRYLAAWEEGDLEAAYSFFSAEVQAENTFEAYERQARPGNEFPDGESAVYIDEAEGEGDRVTLHLTVEYFYGDGGLGGNSYRTPRTVRMVREADGWKIDEPLIGIESVFFGDFPN